MNQTVCFWYTQNNQFISVICLWIEWQIFALLITTHGSQSQGQIKRKMHFLLFFMAHAPFIRPIRQNMTDCAMSGEGNTGIDLPIKNWSWEWISRGNPVVSLSLHTQFSGHSPMNLKASFKSNILNIEQHTYT